MKKAITLLFVVFISTQLFSQSTLQDSLQLYYLFNGDASDISGNGHDGTVYGAQLTENRFGQPDGAYEFDGYNDYINSFSTFDYEERSISLWVNPHEIEGYSPNNHVVVSQDDYRLNYGCMRVDFENYKLKLWAGGASNLYIDDASKMLDKWSHIVMVRNAEIVKYYINAALVKTANANNVASTFEPDSNFIIGAGRSTYKQHFKGKIDDIRIYNRVLTEDEITRLFIYDIQVGLEELKLVQTYNQIKIKTNLNSVYNLRIIDIMGRTVFENRNIKSTEIYVNKSKIPKGLNIIQITENNKQVFIRKVII
ncbi:MAG: hypothetical protein C0595_11585 [Marinilabiliales bacterium]|nr:MAG: hypothetical protein C0595_11585 [Marinilabiliales bacterium]